MESIRLAFVAALQHLPARQRAVLILCEVLRWQAAEVAELLDTSVAAVNSALQRARATLAVARPERARRRRSDAEQADLLGPLRGRLRALRRRTAGRRCCASDAVQSMPPYAMWLAGARTTSAAGCSAPASAAGGLGLLPTAANGCPAFGQYRVDPHGGHTPWALQVLEISGDRIAGIHSFLEPERLFPAFGLPAHLPE